MVFGGVVAGVLFAAGVVGAAGVLLSGLLFGASVAGGFV
ncbi:MAG: hypothetical protein RHS_5250 [Robinsoniella sp. RHS]|nr:MAG: hypothetical protein RHS_5250 [Robinsoniella sp. RHS]